MRVLSGSTIKGLKRVPKDVDQDHELPKKNLGRMQLFGSLMHREAAIPGSKFEASKLSTSKNREHSHLRGSVQRNFVRARRRQLAMELLPLLEIQLHALRPGLTEADQVLAGWHATDLVTTATVVRVLAVAGIVFSTGSGM